MREFTAGVLGVMLRRCRSDVMLSHSDVLMSATQSDVMCSFSRAKHTSQSEAVLTHEVRITFRLRNTSFQKRKSSPLDCFRFWLRRWDLKGPLENIVVSVRSTGLASDTPCFLPCRVPSPSHRERSRSKPTPSPPLCGGGGSEWLKSHRSKKRTDTRLGVCLFLCKGYKKDIFGGVLTGFELHDLQVMS